MSTSTATTYLSVWISRVRLILFPAMRMNHTSSKKCTVRIVPSAVRRSLPIWQERDNCPHFRPQVCPFRFSGRNDDAHTHRHGAVAAVGGGHQPRNFALVDAIRIGLGANLALLLRCH